MLHIVKLIERRFPQQSTAIVDVALAISLLAMLAGIAFLLLR